MPQLRHSHSLQLSIHQRCKYSQRYQPPQAAAYLRSFTTRNSAIMVDQGEVQKDKMAGNVKSAAGNVQQKAGELFGSDEQQAKGAARDASGQAKHDTAETKGYVQGAVDTVVGGAKNIIGQVTGDNQQQGEGKAQQKSGDTQRGINS